MGDGGYFLRGLYAWGVGEENHFDVRQVVPGKQLLVVVVVIENVRLRACTKTGTILTNTIQFLFESYPILM